MKRAISVWKKRQEADNVLVEQIQSELSINKTLAALSEVFDKTLYWIVLRISHQFSYHKDKHSH